MHACSSFVGKPSCFDALLLSDASCCNLLPPAVGLGLGEPLGDFSFLLARDTWIAPLNCAQAGCLAGGVGGASRQIAAARQLMWQALCLVFVKVRLPEANRWG